MARVIVKAIANPWNAESGSRTGAAVVVSVTNARGEPVKGLGQSDFHLRRSPSVDPGNLREVQITTFWEYLQQLPAAGLPGFYLMVVHPSGTDVWNPGLHILQVVVLKGTALKGQTLVSINVP